MTVHEYAISDISPCKIVPQKQVQMQVSIESKALQVKPPQGMPVEIRTWYSAEKGVRCGITEN